MVTGEDPCCAAGGGGSAALLAEFRTWLDRKRVCRRKVRCYGKQVKAFLAAIGGREW